MSFREQNANFDTNTRVQPMSQWKKNLIANNGGNKIKIRVQLFSFLINRIITIESLESEICIVVCVEDPLL